ncbi:MAG: hypothetical protein HC890_16165 [Chloroflexaceae bacterium]|nr:hypothetical protein [Chloroflexaceae bacterium]
MIFLGFLFLPLSPAFAQEGQAIAVLGRLTTEGAECQTLRTTDGKNTLFSLLGTFVGFPSGLPVIVYGTIVELSSCQAGTTIFVQSISDSSPLRPRS